MSGQLELTRLPWPRLANLDLLATLPWDSPCPVCCQKVHQARLHVPGQGVFAPFRRLDPQGLELLRFEVGACFPGMSPHLLLSTPVQVLRPPEITTMAR